MFCFNTKDNERNSLENIFFHLGNLFLTDDAALYVCHVVD